MLKVIVCLFLIYQPVWLYSQRIDNAAIARQVYGEKYFRFHYDNDFFTKTYYYYTQGYQFELVAPVLKGNPVNLVLFPARDGNRKYGLSFEHYGFTPTSIAHDEILAGDRPFAGVIMLKSFGISTNPDRRERISVVLSTGMIGPAAFAGRMQATIHRWTNDAVPHGWQHQIRNDIVFNYEFNIEKELYSLPNIIALQTNANIAVGTLSDKAQAGFTLALGKFGSPFIQPETAYRKNFRLYIYRQPAVSLIGYDATLQGGLFNRSSPYFIQAKEMSRLTFQNTSGLVVNISRLYLEYNRTFLTREFRAGKRHQWGGVKIGCSF